MVGRRDVPFAASSMENFLVFFFIVIAVGAGAYLDLGTPSRESCHERV